MLMMVKLLLLPDDTVQVFVQYAFGLQLFHVQLINVDECDVTSVREISAAAATNIVISLRMPMMAVMMMVIVVMVFH